MHTGYPIPTILKNTYLYNHDNLHTHVVVEFLDNMVHYYSNDASKFVFREHKKSGQDIRGESSWQRIVRR